MPSPTPPSVSLPATPMRSHAAVQWLLGCTLVFAPLFRSGQPALAVMALELLAVSILMLVLWCPRRDFISRREAMTLVLLLAFPLLYLMPLPAVLTGALPGWQPYLTAHSLIEGAAGNSLTFSIYPLETESAFLLLLLPISVFLGTRMLDAQRVFQLVLLLLGIASAQALFGLLQYGAGKGSPELFGLSFANVRSASGTYTNRNHLAGLLEMLLPITLALTFFTVGRKHGNERPGWRGRIAFLASLRGHTALVYGMIALLLLLGAVFTRSRAGISLSILGIILSTMMFARRLGGDNVHGVTGTIVAIALGSGVAIGLIPVLDRFSVEGTIQDARWTIFSSTLDGIGAFAPLGSGFGNYPDVFPIFQPLELGRWFINHAHNDYLEWLFEGGIVAGALILLFLILYSMQWGKVWCKGPWSRFRFVQVASGIGLLLLMLHSLVDYNLHIPANIVYFAFLTGVFFCDPVTEDEPARRTRKRRRTPDLTQASSSPAVAKQERPAPPPDQIKNPFLD